MDLAKKIEAVERERHELIEQSFGKGERPTREQRDELDRLGDLLDELTRLEVSRRLAPLRARVELFEREAAAFAAKIEATMKSHKVQEAYEDAQLLAWHIINLRTSNNVNAAGLMFDDAMRIHEPGWAPPWAED